jgi:hypothetical protein
MPTRAEFKADLSLQLGLSVPPLAAQCQGHGLILSNAELWEQRHQAWLLLRVGGFLTDNEAEKIGVRITNAIALEVGFDSAVATALDLLTNSLQERKPEEGANEGTKAEPTGRRDEDVLNRKWIDLDNPGPVARLDGQPDRIGEYLNHSNREPGSAGVEP